MSPAPTLPIPFFADLNRFHSKYKVNPKNGCWEWFSAFQGGYGVFSIRDITYKAHRISLHLHLGTLDLNLYVDHICRNRKCVNPDHLREVDARTNVMENSQALALQNASKVQCYRGHSFDQDNTYVNPKGQRMCLICRTINSRINEPKRNKKVRAYQAKVRYRKKILADLF